MSSIIKLLSIFLLTWVYSTTYSQTKVTGKVIDKKTGAAMPYATVYFEGKKIGGKADGNGNFSLYSPNAESKVYASFIGYQENSVSIKPNETNDVIIKIVEVGKRSKKEAVVRSTRKLAKDTLANKIIRLVIKNKDKNKPSAYESIQYDKYKKFEVDLANIDSQQGGNFISKPLKYILEYQNQTPDGERYSPILFRETFSKEYIKGDKKKIKIIGVKDSRIFENESIFALLDYAFEDYNIYDNQVIIANKPLISPVSDLAMLFYRYYIEDSFKSNGLTNYIMTFAPISKNDYGFTGKLTIEEGSWAVKEVDLGIDKRANINFVNYLNLKQTFSKKGDRYLVTRDEKDIAMALSKNEKTRYKARFRQTELIDRIKINEPISDSIFYGEETDYMPNYKKIDEAFIKANRQEELSEFEAGIYTRTDSFKKTSQYKTLKYWTRVVSSAFFPIPPVNLEVGRVYQFFSWNKFEGYRIRLGARTMFDDFKNQNLTFHVAYGTEDRKFKYGMEYFYNFPKVNRRWNQLYFTASHDYQRLGESDNLLFFDNIVQSLFRTKENRISDIILKDDVRLVWTKEWLRGVQTTLGFNKMTFYPNSSFPFELVNNDGTYTPLSQLNSTRVTTSFRFSPKEPVFENEFYRRRLTSIRPVITLSASFGAKGFWHSNYGFMKLNSEFKQTIPFFIGNFYYNFQAGSVLGTVPYIDLFSHGGNRSFLNDDSRYMLMEEGEFVSDAYAQLWINHKFNGFFFNKIPVLKSLKLREFVFAKALTGSISQQNQGYIRVPGTIESPGTLYAEAGAGVSNIFKFINVYFAWRLTQLDKPTSRPFGVLLEAGIDL